MSLVDIVSRHPPPSIPQDPGHQLAIVALPHVDFIIPTRDGGDFAQTQIVSKQLGSLCFEEIGDGKLSSFPSVVVDFDEFSEGKSTKEEYAESFPSVVIDFDKFSEAPLFEYEFPLLPLVGTFFLTIIGSGVLPPNADLFHLLESLAHDVLLTEDLLFSFYLPQLVVLNHFLYL